MCSSAGGFRPDLRAWWELEMLLVLSCKAGSFEDRPILTTSRFGQPSDRAKDVYQAIDSMIVRTVVNKAHI